MESISNLSKGKLTVEREFAIDERCRANGNASLAKDIPVDLALKYPKVGRALFSRTYGTGKSNVARRTVVFYKHFNAPHGRVRCSTLLRVLTNGDYAG